MTFPPLTRRDGTPLQLGQFAQTIEWQAISEELPAAPWVLTGSPVIADTAVDVPHISVALPSGNREVRLGSVSVNRLRAVRFDLIGLRCADVASVQMRMQPTTPGTSPDRGGVLGVVNLNSASPAYFLKRNAVQHPTVYAPYRAGFGVGTINLGMLWSIDAKCAYLFEGDEVVGAVNLDEDFIAPETVSPGAVFYSPGAAGNRFELSGLKATFWYD